MKDNIYSHTDTNSNVATFENLVTKIIGTNEMNNMNETFGNLANSIIKMIGINDNNQTLKQEEVKSNELNNKQINSNYYSYMTNSLTRIAEVIGVFDIKCYRIKEFEQYNSKKGYIKYMYFHINHRNQHKYLVLKITGNIRKNKFSIEYIICNILPSDWRTYNLKKAKFLFGCECRLPTNKSECLLKEFHSWYQHYFTSQTNDHIILDFREIINIFLVILLLCIKYHLSPNTSYEQEWVKHNIQHNVYQHNVLTNIFFSAERTNIDLSIILSMFTLIKIDFLQSKSMLLYKKIMEVKDNLMAQKIMLIFVSWDNIMVEIEYSKIFSTILSLVDVSINSIKSWNLRSWLIELNYNNNVFVKEFINNNVFVKEFIEFIDTSYHQKNNSVLEIFSEFLKEKSLLYTKQKQTNKYNLFEFLENKKIWYGLKLSKLILYVLNIELEIKHPRFISDILASPMLTIYFCCNIIIWIINKENIIDNLSWFYEQ